MQQKRGKHKKLPVWLKKRLAHPGKLAGVKDVLDRLQLETVCREAHCPNLCECFARGTATFMILGAICSRNCRFCAVNSSESPGPLEPDEPQRVAEAVRELGLKHVVITSVTRDDLEDGGSKHFARTIAEVRDLVKDATLEVLTPDFQGRRTDIARVIDAGPDIYNHNLETVPRLYAEVRPQADYERSLDVIRQVSDSGLRAKSGLMLGMGEHEEEIVAVMKDLVEAGCDSITLGQYLAPSDAHFEVKEFVTPEEFESLGKRAYSMGFKAVGSAPFVRSSYNADLMAEKTLCGVSPQ